MKEIMSWLWFEKVERWMEHRKLCMWDWICEQCFYYAKSYYKSYYAKIMYLYLHLYL